MIPDVAQIARIYTRNVGDTVPNNTITLKSSNFEVVVEAEAGSQLVGFGVAYTLTIAAFDYTVGNNPTAIPAEANFSQAETPATNFGTWAATGDQHTAVFTVKVATLTDVQNHILQYYAMLTAGTGGNEVATFAASPLFTVIQ